MAPCRAVAWAVCRQGLPPGFVAGVTAPQYGMPISGTPIGLPGPPHMPLGDPAGLQKHVMKNHTKMHIPGPNRTVKIHVKQEPGFSYPKPANRVWINERSHLPPTLFQQPKTRPSRRWCPTAVRCRRHRSINGRVPLMTTTAKCNRQCD